MKKLLLIYLLISLTNLLSAQNYGHILFTIPERNLLPAAIYQFEDRIITPTIYPGIISSVISLLIRKAAIE